MGVEYGMSLEERVLHASMWPLSAGPARSRLTGDADFTSETAPSGTYPSPGCLKAERRRRQKRYTATTINRPVEATKAAGAMKKEDAFVMKRLHSENAKSDEEKRRRIVNLLRAVGNPVGDWRTMGIISQSAVLRPHNRYEAYRPSGRPFPRVQYGRLKQRMSETAAKEKWGNAFELLATQAEQYDKVTTRYVSTVA